MSTPLVNRIMLGALLCVTSFVARSSNGAILLNWQFESVTGSPQTATTPDSSGAVTPLTGTLLGGPTVGTNYPTQVTSPFVSNGTVTGLNPNSSMQFFGGNSSSTGATNSSNRVFLADGAAGGGSSTVDALFSQFTFAAWINAAEVTTSTRWIAGKMGGSSGERGWQVARGYGTSGVNVNNLEFTYFDGPSGASEDLSVTNFFTSASEWIHLAVVFDGIGDGVDPLTRSVKIYKNGVEVLNHGGALANLNGANSQPFMVGNRGAIASGSWYGYIDDVRIYNNALNQAGVDALMVPEPSSVALLACACFGVAALCRCRR